MPVGGILDGEHPAKRFFVSRQADYFRLAESRYDLTIKRLALLTGIPASTMAAWKAGGSMPAWALFELAQHVPDDLNSMLVERSNKYIGTCEEGEGDLDALGREAAGYTSDLLEARDPAGPGGTTIVPIEKARLKERARRVACKARAAAA